MRIHSRLFRPESLEERRLLSVSAPLLSTLPTQIEVSQQTVASSVSLGSEAGGAIASGVATSSAASAAATGVFRIYVESGLLSQIQSAIDTYVADLTREGYQVGVEEFSGTAEQLRASLQGHWTNDHLEGAVLVGDLPVVQFTSEDNWTDTPQTVTYAHDLYFMDMDGTYTFSTSGLDSHTGDVAPEIYISRITTGNLGNVTGRNEATLINDYFAKVHDYRTGRLTFDSVGIVFKDDDWASYVESGKPDLTMSSVYSNVQTITDAAGTTKQGYLDALQVNAESTLEMTSSDATYHVLKVGYDWEWITSQEIVDANPRQGFYNMFNTHGADYTVADNLIGSYVYGGSYGLNAVGSTKTGGMWDYETFYTAQAQGETVGQAFRDWFKGHASATDSGSSSVDWFYGMTMQGDPTLGVKRTPTASLVDPTGSAMMPITSLNTRHTIDVAFTAVAAGASLDLSTVADAAAEFTLTGAAARGVVVNGTPQAMGDNVYRYTFTGAFGLGTVGVNFIAGSVADSRGVGNVARTSEFTVQPSVSIADLTMNEGASGERNVNFTVTLSARSSQAVTVTYATQDGTATADSDYRAIAGGTLTFKPGETKKTISVRVLGDKVYENSETFAVHLTGSSGAVIDKGTATGTIRNDDAKPALSIGKVAIAEGNAATTAFNFIVTLSRASGLPVTVHYATANGTAQAGSDFAAVAGDLTFLPDETQKTITVAVNGDTMYEAKEAFSVVLSAADGATIARGRSTGAGTILNDDLTMPAVAIGNATIVSTPAGASAQFSVTLSAPSGVAATVKLATSNGTARARYDYTAVSTSLRFEPGETVKTVLVPILGNLADKAGLVFYASISRPGKATLGATTKGNCTIQPLGAANLSGGRATLGGSATSSPTQQRDAAIDAAILYFVQGLAR